jgi:hypothetical protein
MSQTDSIVARIMRIRNGMILDADAEALIRREIVALDAPRTSPVTASARDAFEAWATSDNRAIQPLQFEERTDYNNHYYESDHDNNAFIGWKAAGLAQSTQESGDPEIKELRRLADDLVAEGWHSDAVFVRSAANTIERHAQTPAGGVAGDPITDWIYQRTGAAVTSALCNCDDALDGSAKIARCPVHGDTTSPVGDSK